MKKTMYSIYDMKTDEFLHPFMEINEDTAKRQFYQTMDSVPVMRSHPADFNLFQIGDFDLSSGVLNSNPDFTSKFIITGLNCIKFIQKGANDETSKVSNESPVQSST